MSDDLAAFLAARLDEVEAAAHASGSACVAWLTYRDTNGGMLYTTIAARHGDWEPWVADRKDLPEPSSARVVYDPASVLRSVAADRRILERHTRSTFPGNPEPWCEWCSDEDETGIGPEPWPCRDLLDRLSVFAAHPDFNPKWRP